MFKIYFSVEEEVVKPRDRTISFTKTPRLNATPASTFTTHSYRGPISFQTPMLLLQTNGTAHGPNDHISQTCIAHSLAHSSYNPSSQTIPQPLAAPPKSRRSGQSTNHGQQRRKETAKHHDPAIRLTATGTNELHRS